MAAAHKLTETKISKAKPKEKPYKLSDGHGLYLHVVPNGSKLWRWQYRFNGVPKLMSFGAYPVISLEKIRDIHSEARKTLKSGIDPMAKRREGKLQEQSERKLTTILHAVVENTFRAIEAKWYEQWKVGKTPRHACQIEDRIEADILPKLGDRPIAEIEVPEIVAMAKAIEARGAGDLARRSLNTTGQIFRYAIAHGLAARNPVSDIKPRDILKEIREKNFARIDQKELPTLLRAMEYYRGTAITRIAIKLLALTFVRTSELIEAPWTEFDLDGARWDIPAGRMKTTAMPTPHIVPLAHQAVELLRTLRGFTGDTPWLFPGDRNRRKCMSNNTILKALERMGYKGVMTGHGFRGLASTILHEQGYPDEHIELQLAHQQRDKVAAAYNYAKYLGPRKNMMQDWADYLDQQLRGAKVLKMLKG
jgi:integrase